MNNKVSLRPIEIEDLSMLHKWRNDADIFNHLGGGFIPTSKYEMSQWMANFSKRDLNNFRFIIEYDGQSVGFISLTNVSYLHRNGVLGIYIGESKFKNKGIASSALKLLHEFSTKNLNLLKVKLNVNHNNIDALRLYEKNGYKKVGLLEKDKYINGEWLNVILMEHFLERNEE